MNRILRRVRPEPGRVRNFGPDSGQYRLEQEVRIAEQTKRVEAEEEERLAQAAIAAYERGEPICPDCRTDFPSRRGVANHRRFGCTAKRAIAS